MAALAHRCAVITTEPRIALKELTDGENVLLVPPEQPDALADAITRLISDPSLRARLQAGAGALSRLFEWDSIAARTAELFSALLSG
jgi:glycosyltransferase involved in cell wall biosynthesis